MEKVVSQKVVVFFDDFIFCIVELHKLDKPIIPPNGKDSKKKKDECSND